MSDEDGQHFFANGHRVNTKGKKYSVKAVFVCDNSLQNMLRGRYYMYLAKVYVCWCVAIIPYRIPAVSTL